MNDERLVREIWKELPHRDVVGHLLGRRVGARAWERPRFGRFRRFFERCGVPDPWDPEAPQVDVALGDVGVAAARRPVAPHAAPPSTSASASKPANAPPGPRIPGPSPKPPGEGGKPAPRIGDTRADDTAVLKKKSLEAEKKKINPSHANAYKVNQPVAKLPMRPDRLPDGAAPASGAPAAPSRPPAPGASPASASPRPAVPSATRPAGAGPAAPLRPGVERPAGDPPRPPRAPPPSGPPRPSRMAGEPTRRVVLPDGPEEVVDAPPPPPAARPGAMTAYAGFGMGGDWDDEPAPRAQPVSRPEEPVPAPTPPVSTPAPVVPASAAPTPPSEPPRTPLSQPPSAPPRPPPPSAQPAPPRPPSTGTHAPAVPRPSPPSAPPSTPPRPPPGPPRPRGGGGLDDLFGMGGGGDNTRVRMPKREDEASKPKRPMVTPDSELKAGTIDRRPPPPKPPVVVPTSGGRAAPDPEGDGGD